VAGSACFASTTQAGAKTVCGKTSGNTYFDTANPGNYDIAENYQTSDPSLSAGDIVSVNPSSPKNIMRATTGGRVLGVISTNPGVLLGGSNPDILTATMRPVALSGRIPAKVSLEGGPISIGDSITLSSTPGVGMKASGSSEIVGIALEPYSGNDVGTIDIFANLGQHVDLNQFALASSTSASTTIISDELTATMASLRSLQVQTSDLAAQIGVISSTSENLASTTAIALASSTSFIQTIANAVVNLLNQSGQIISSAGNWTVGTITAMTANFQKVIASRVETQTAAISQGLEMKDQATGLTYCVIIKNGEWDKTQGNCGQSGTATTTITSIPVASSLSNSVSSPLPVSNTISQNVGTTSITVVSDLATSTAVVPGTSTPTTSVAVVVGTSTPVNSIVTPDTNISAPNTAVTTSPTPDPVTVSPSTPTVDSTSDTSVTN
jgi:hypothetical protein